MYISQEGTPIMALLVDLQDGNKDTMTPCGLTKHTWKSLAKEISQIRPEFAQIINEISPSDDYSLYVGEYTYGSLLLDKGVFQVINDRNELVPLSDDSIDSNIREDLSYTGTIPLSMVAEKSIETFFTFDNRTIPSSFYTQGEMVSLWRVLEGDCSYQEGPLWSISSGARSICILPKVTDKVGINNLKKIFHSKTKDLSTLQGHWKLFTHLANHEKFSQPWKSRVIYFSRKWFEHRNDKEWLGFFQFILNQAWQDSTYKRNQFIFDFAFSLMQKNRNLKPNPYLADTVKYLIGVGSTGGMPGLAPAIDDQAAPITGLQRAYLENYCLKKYVPTIMHTYHFSLDESRPVYYSLKTPITTMFSPRSAMLSSKMKDLRELKYILENFLSETLKGKLMIEKTPLYSLAKNINYEFYHCDPDHYNEISPVSGMPKSDKNLMSCLVKSSNKNFPEFSPFFRGCVQVAKSKK